MLQNVSDDFLFEIFRRLHDSNRLANYILHLMGNTTAFEVGMRFTIATVIAGQRTTNTAGRVNR